MRFKLIGVLNRVTFSTDETIKISQYLLSRMNKEWIVVKDSPGFVSNRVLMLTINEAVSAEKVRAVFIETYQKRQLSR